MRHTGRRLLPWLVLGGSLAAASDIVYVTDLTIFTELAPCAASALSYNVMAMTYSSCPQAVTDLQSCVCSKGNNPSSLQAAISKSVSYSCGSTATDDQASASKVYAGYCNQAKITPFPKPTQIVPQYIMDFPEWAELAPCAANAVSLNVMSMTYDLCPTDASLLAPCVCQKNQNSLRVSQAINTSAKSSCSGHTADVSSAQALFSAYCGLNNGTSSFPTPSNPPGDMTYYITGMGEYRSLAPCAQSALSAGVFSQTYDMCPPGPKALASCACIKDGMPGLVSAVITSGVRYSCDKTASADISSALSVWDIYCSAAKGLTRPAGVTESVEQTSPPARTGNGSGSGPQPTGGNGANADSGNSSDKSADSSNGAKSNVPIIAGAVVGIVLGLGAIGAVLFYFMWRRRHAKGGNKEEATQNLTNDPGDTTWKPELDSTAPAVIPTTGSPSVSSLKPDPPTRADNVSPVSAHGPPKPELSSTPVPRPQPELQGNHVSEAYGQPLHEAPSQVQGADHLAQGQTAAATYSYQPHMGWQSGPVHEMDGGYGGGGYGGGHY
ncbi:hypothetical protein PG993_005406 [Apiospora rasikravindrae]|uniref:Extracellular membrane protein CFEM domain-containing protein n=1 Tax=Apiospora rasikravindrae TaxID=990691 RepID=A0ABR1TG52_9PEZI